MIVLLAGLVGILAGAYAGYCWGRAHQLSIDMDRMRPLCEELQAFVDGELPDSTADLMRAHLGSCAVCQDDLQSLMQEQVRMDALAEEVRAWQAAGGRGAASR